MRRAVLIAMTSVLFLGISYAETKYVKKDDIKKTMKGFNNALDVDCRFCHVKDKTVSIKETDKYDMEKEFGAMRHKRIARAMIGMKMMFDDQNKTKTTCKSCHQGNPTPPEKK